MKNALCIVWIIGLSACLQSQTKSDEESTPAPIQTLLQQQGCSVKQNGNKVTMSCTDGSSVDFSTPPTPPSFHVRDQVQDYPNLQFASLGAAGFYFVNTLTGNILTYDPQGALAGPSVIYFAAANCAGAMWTSEPVPMFANQIFLNLSTAPGFTGVTIGAKVTGKTSLSNYNTGASGCQNQTTNEVGTWYNVTPVSFNESVPNQFTMPLTLEYN